MIPLAEQLNRRIGRFKPMTDYDWSGPKKIDRDAVERARRWWSWRGAVGLSWYFVSQLMGSGSYALGAMLSAPNA